ncbi:MAG: hypothetical protein IPO95_06380 [Rhodanobacteraceae bacterium]|nr:hypothetical protein [Rhodanobacteraceae bacterium]MBP6078504.1 hypothetical protein [Xanthomonadales bacterium]MBP7623626.1 hypothetical protein [Xanthomonadales bacterium]
MSVLSAVRSLGLAALIAALPTAAQEVGDAPALISDTQYTAVFTQSQSSWLLHPAAAGALMRLDVRCRDDAAIAPGLWLVTTDAVGQVELVAPSVTVLPPGHPERIPLLACDSAVSGGLHLPAKFIQTLAREHGAVRIDG